MAIDDLKKDHEQFLLVMKEASLLRWKKLKCYGRTYADYGILGISIKINDKAGRLKSLMHNKELRSEIKDESMRDTVIDMLNYCAMWVMLHDNSKR